MRAPQLLAAILALGSAAAMPAAADTLTRESVISDQGVGPVRFGMTPEEASAAAGVPLAGDPAAFTEGDTSCYYVQAPGDLAEAFTFMVSDGKIARISVYEQPEVANAEGVRIGDSEAHVLEVYKDAVVADVASEYGEGHAITTHSADGLYGYVFDTDGKTVTDWRAGRYPEVEWVEGCY